MHYNVRLMNLKLIDYIPSNTNIDVINATKNLYNNSKVSISYQRGDLERFLTISGIVTENNKGYQSQIIYKKASNELKGLCNCPHWKDLPFCHHSLCLLEYYLQQKINEDLIQNFTPEHFFSHLVLNNKGTHPSEYGLYYKTPQELKGTTPKDKFNTTNYILTSGRIVNLPQNRNPQVSLGVELLSCLSSATYQFHKGYENLFFPKFYIINEDKTINEKISLLDHYGAFHWENGKLSQLSDVSWEYFQLYHEMSTARTIDEHLHILESISEIKEIKINKMLLQDLTPVKPVWELSLHHSGDETLAKIEMKIHSPDRKILPIPFYFKAISQNGGWLNSFDRKVDAYQYLHTLSTQGEQESKLVLQYSRYRKNIKFFSEDSKKENFLILPDSPIKYVFSIPETQKCIHYLAHLFKDDILKSARFTNHSWEVYFSKEKAFDRLSSLIEFLGDNDIQFFMNSSPLKYWRPNVKFERKEDSIDWFNLNLDINNEDLSLIKKYDPTKNYLQSKGELLFIDEKNKALFNFLKRSLVKPDGEKTDENHTRFHLHYRRSQIFELLEIYRHGLGNILTENELSFCQKLKELDSIPNVDLGPNINGTLRHYQQDGVNWIHFLYENRFGACLADDMGLGKTLQAICFTQSIIHKVNRILIVCPVSIISNWEKEFQRFSNLKPYIYYGSQREYPSIDHKIILTSYGVLKNDVESIFLNERFDMVIFDEIQNLKNQNSKGAAAARKINTSFRLSLTGTPVENDISEFFNIIDLTLPGIWGQKLNFSNALQKKLLAKNMAKPFVLRRTKKQVLQELPEKIESYVYLDFTDEERASYVNQLKEIQEEMLAPGSQYQTASALKNLLRLRKLCLWQHFEKMFSSKINYLMESLEQLMEENHKVLIFSQFTTYLDHIQTEIEKMNWSFSRIDGSYSLKKREQEIESFQNDKSSIFLISLKAGGLGLNLTQANYIFLMDPWWNPAVENQAIDRAYRIGQKRNLTVYRPIIKNSVEEKVLLLQEKKKELFKDLLGSDSDEIQSGKLTSEDFKYLLGL